MSPPAPRCGWLGISRNGESAPPTPSRSCHAKFPRKRASQLPPFRGADSSAAAIALMKSAPASAGQGSLDHRCAIRLVEQGNRPSGLFASGHRPKAPRGSNRTQIPNPLSGSEPATAGVRFLQPLPHADPALSAPPTWRGPLRRTRPSPNFFASGCRAYSEVSSSTTVP